MAPFKFGKKKNKEGSDLNASPASSKNNHQGVNSPQASTASNQSKNQGYQDSPASAYGPATSLNTPKQGEYQAGIAYDHNNNIFNSTSPQRSTPGALQQTNQQQFGYGSPQQHQFHHNSPQGQHLFQTPPNTATPSPWSRSKLLISPFPRYRHTASSHSNEKGEVFVMGGLHNTSVYGDTWVFKTDNEAKHFETFQVDIYENSPAPRVGHASTVCGNAYVIFGGDTVTNEAGEIDNDLYLFNMNTHSWTIPHPVGKRPSGRYGHTIGVIALTNFDSKIYLYGGQLDDVVYNDLAVFNLSSFRRPDVQWEWVTPDDHIQPPGLTNHTMDAYDNKLWLFGGSTGQRLSNDLWVFDPLSNKWDKIKTTGISPPPVEEHASAIYKDLLVVHGGKNVHGDALTDVYFLNLVTKTWYRLPKNLALESPAKYGHTLSLLKNDKLLILGGHLPDYARLGDDLEPSSDDNGVGTILNVLDLKNLNKIIPGLYQYSTPVGTNSQERFPNQQHLSQHNQQQIFTPPGSQPRTRQSSDNQKLPHSFPPSTGSNGINGAPFKQQPSHGQPALSPSNPVEQNTSSASLSTRSQQQQQPPPPTHQQLSSSSRGVSAEDVFQRQVEVQRSLSKHNTPGAPQSQSQSQAESRQGYSTQDHEYMGSSVDNAIHSSEELPLELPSPVRPEIPIPAPVAKDEVPLVKDTDNATIETLNQHGTPISSPERAANRQLSGAPVAPSAGYLTTEDGKSSDILDSYVTNSSSNLNLAEKAAEKSSEPASTYKDSLPLVDFEQVPDHELERSLTTHRPTNSDGPVRSSSQGFNQDYSKPSTGDKTLGGTSVSTTGTGAGITDVSIASAAAIGAAAAVGVKKIFGPDSKDDVTEERGPKAFHQENSSLRDIPGSFTSPLVATSSVKNDDEKQQFKIVIDQMSKELEQLKLKTNEQAKAASAKVTELEKENETLRAKVLEAPENHAEPVEDEREVKRNHIKLTTDYEILKEEYEILKSKFSEIEPIFTSNLIDLEKLNDIIKKQELQLHEKTQKLKDNEEWKFKYDELKLKYDALEEKLKEQEEIADRSLTEGDAADNDIKKLTTGLDSFLNKFRSQDDDSFDTSRSLSKNGEKEGNGRVVTSLRSQIDDLLKENEEVHARNESLSKDIEDLKSQSTEIAALKAKVSELSKIEENYKESLHSVKSTSRALQVSQSELAKQKEISIKLQQEMDELKIFNARKNSRNATPVVNEFENRKSTIEDDDFENEHYNMKIRDLQAELFITKQDNDDLKQEILTLKKKLLVSTTPTSSL